jgi:hypothetical protein
MTCWVTPICVNKKDKFNSVGGRRKRITYRKKIEFIIILDIEGIGDIDHP